MSVKEVENIFRRVFEDPKLELSPALTAKDVQNWDSFNHINLIVDLEEHFGVKFTTKEMGGMTNVGDLIEFLQKKGKDVSW